MRWVLLLVALMGVVSCGKNEEAKEPATESGITRDPKTPVAPPPTEMVYDQRDIKPSFERVGNLFDSGFDEADAEKLRIEILALKEGVKKDWTYEVVYKGQQVQMKVFAIGSAAKLPVIRFEAPNEEMLKAIEKAM